jgi:hypothetical protein
LRFFPLFARLLSVITRFLFPDPTDGGMPSSTGGALPATGGTTADQPAPAPEIPAPEPPPAAKIVVQGQISEREIELQAELDAERASHAETAAQKKQREIKIAELERERGELREALHGAPAHAPKKSCIEKFFAGESED